MQKYFLLSLFLAAFSIASDCAYSQLSDAPPFSGDTAGIVNGRPISRKEYTEMFAEVSQSMMQQKKGSLSGQEILDAHRKTWDALVSAAIINDSIEKKGITVSDQEVKAVLETDPPNFLKMQFTDSTGKFRKEDYMQALKDPKNAAIVQNLVDAMKGELRKQKLSNILLSQVTVTDEELWKEYKEQKGATRKKFESEKDKLRAKRLQTKQQAFIANWFASAKANAKVIDYRTFK